MSRPRTSSAPAGLRLRVPLLPPDKTPADLPPLPQTPVVETDSNFETPAIPNSPPSLIGSSGASTISSATSCSSRPLPQQNLTYFPPGIQPFTITQNHGRPVAANNGEKYTRVFTSRLLGYTQHVDPVDVTSYDPCTGLSHTLWVPEVPTRTFAPNAGGRQKSRSTPYKTGPFADPHCIIVSIAGRLNPTTHTLTYGVFHGPGSFRNVSGAVPLSSSELTRTNLHAELYATEKALEQVLDLLKNDDESSWWPDARNVVIVTDSSRIMNTLSSCVYAWKAKGWTKSRGKRPVANAATWRTISELADEIEMRGVGVRFWTVSEAVNADAVRLAWAAEPLAQGAPPSPPPPPPPPPQSTSPAKKQDRKANEAQKRMENYAPPVQILYDSSGYPTPTQGVYHMPPPTPVTPSPLSLQFQPPWYWQGDLSMVSPPTSSSYSVQTFADAYGYQNPLQLYAKDPGACGSCGARRNVRPYEGQLWT